MSGIAWDRVAEVFADALELPPDERRAAVLRRCEGEPALLAAVERLLVAHGAADPGFPGRVDRALLEAVATGGGQAPQRLGPWRLGRELGQGGMGRVFLAERVDGQFEQRAALKLLKRGMDSDALLARFLRERQILAALDHPNIARLLDGGVAPDGRPYFVMEYVEGQPITRYADAHRLSIDRRLDLFCTVCLAVEYAHRNLIVHRDLKPSNILVSDDGVPKLLDFGIAKLLSQADVVANAPPLTDAGIRPMTPEYAAPEQFLGGPITTSTDVYGLGCVLHELLVGFRVRHPAGLPGVDRRAADHEPIAASAMAASADASAAAARSTDLARLRRRLEGDLDTILAAALRPDPERRYASVGALREDIRRHQARLPVTARTDTAAYRVSRFVRRHQIGLLATSAIAVLLAAFGVTALVQARALGRERDHARREARAAAQVSDFLVGIFEVADPMRTGLGDSIRARELLDRGARRIEVDLAGQPELMARMLTVIGRAYENLARGDLAEPLVLRALDLQRSRPGRADSAAVTMLRELARIRVHRGNYAGARATIRQAMALQDRIDPRAPTALALVAELASAFHMDGERDSAAAAVDMAMAMLERTRADGLDDSRDALRRILTVLGYSRDWARIERIHARLVEAERRAEGPRSEAVAVAYTDWAETRRNRGDLAAADSLLRLALGIHREHGLRSVAAARTLAELADLAAGRGMLDRADSLSRAAIDVYRTRLGDDHRTVALARARFAGLLLRTGRAREAIPLYEQAIANYRAGSDDPAYLPVTEARLANALHEVGRLAESADLFDRALHGHEARFPPDYILTAGVRRDYGRVLIELGRARDAEPLLRQALAVMTARWGEHDARVDEVRTLLGRARIVQRRPGQAEPLPTGAPRDP